MSWRVYGDKTLAAVFTLDEVKGKEAKSYLPDGDVLVHVRGGQPVAFSEKAGFQKVPSGKPLDEVLKMQPGDEVVVASKQESEGRFSCTWKNAKGTPFEGDGTVRFALNLKAAGAAAKAALKGMKQPVGRYITTDDALNALMRELGKADLAPEMKGTPADAFQADPKLLAPLSNAVTKAVQEILGRSGFTPTAVGVKWKFSH